MTRRDPPGPAWLNAAFGVSALAIAALVGVAIVREDARPARYEQRLVPALGVIDRCERCHDAATHPGAWLDQHAPERFGCTPCHEGQGLATTARAAHGVSLGWEHPLLTRPALEGACGRCHQEPEVPGAPVLSRGRAALAERGCAGCHVIPGQGLPDFAPALDGLSHKVAPGWVRAWLADPGKVDAAHRMPRFALDDGQTEALVAFLFSRVSSEPPLPPDEPEGDSDRGRSAVATRRCATCHAIEGRGGSVGPSLEAAGLKNRPAWLWAWLRSPHVQHPTTRMPAFRLGDAEIADIVAYATEIWVPDEVPAWAEDARPAGTDPGLVALGRTHFQRLGCAGCHDLAGLARQRTSVVLDAFGGRHVGEMPARTGGDRPPSLVDWVAGKVRDPHAYDQRGAEPALMPAYPRATVDEAIALGVALTSGRKPAITAEYLRARDATDRWPRGATGRLVTRFRCKVCHALEGVGGDVARASLDGVGSRLRQDWLTAFLKEPVTVRTGQAERMPVLGLTPDEAERVADWLIGGLGDDAVVPVAPRRADEGGDPTALLAAERCLACHPYGQGGELKGPTLELSTKRATWDYLVDSLTEGPTTVPRGRHPDQRLTPERARAIAAGLARQAEAAAPPSDAGHP